MNGYTSGVAKGLSEQSNSVGLFVEREKVELNENETLEQALTRHIDNTAGTKLNSEEIAQLLSDGRVMLYDDDYTGVYYDCDTMVLEYDCDPLDVVESFMQGGLTLVTDTDKNILGGRFGVAGEHIGSVSVWLDSYKGTLTQWGETYTVSEQDCDTINEVLQELYD